MVLGIGVKMKEPSCVPGIVVNMSVRVHVAHLHDRLALGTRPARSRRASGRCM